MRTDTTPGRALRPEPPEITNRLEPLAQPWTRLDMAYAIAAVAMLAAAVLLATDALPLTWITTP